MVTIPDRDEVARNIERITWEELSTGDTADRVTPMSTAPACGSVQVTGAFGSGTFALQGSNDGSNWVTLKDVSGSDATLTAAGMIEFSVSCAFIRPSTSGGSSDDLDVVMVLRS